jgi:hypothetical protein
MRQELRPEMLGDVAGGYAATIVRAVQQEYPNDLAHPMTGPHDRPLPRELHPAFYGCYHWHSCVQMHWALVRLLRLAPDALPARDVRTVLGDHLTADALAAEAAYFVGHPGFEGPYGWGWDAAAGPRTVHLGRPGCPALGGEHRPAGRHHRRAVPGVAGTGHLPQP